MALNRIYQKFIKPKIPVSTHNYLKIYFSNIDPPPLSLKEKRQKEQDERVRISKREEEVVRRRISHAINGTPIVPKYKRPIYGDIYVCVSIIACVVVTI